MSGYFVLSVEFPEISSEKLIGMSSRLQAIVEDYLDETGETYQIIGSGPVDDRKPLAIKEPGETRLGGFRADDPDTSRQGAIDAYPRVGSQRHKALMAIARSSEGATYAQVERATGINGIWKRISELKEGGFIFAEGTRLVPETGSHADVYFLTDRGVKYVEAKEGITFA